jgi:radical SAM superfamily enzyme YgiQ (UPF0313 family)
MMIKEITNLISKISSEYSIIAFSVDYMNIPETVLLSAYLKQSNPQIKIIWGGPSITQSRDAFKKFLVKGVSDGLVCGEGEGPLAIIAQGVDLAKIDGVLSYKNGEFYFHTNSTQDLNLFPSPDYTDIPLDTYFNIGSIYRSRGCTHRCTFCAEWHLHGSRFRVRSVQNVIKDIKSLIDQQNPGYIMFAESLINDDLEYFSELCDAMIKEKFCVHFGTHFRANITPEIAEKALKAGFNDAWVGIEAFNERELRRMAKGTSINKNITTIESLTKAGLNVIAMLVAGSGVEKEEEENCKNTIEAIHHFSRNRIIDNEGRSKGLSLQWRVSPMFVMPSSTNYLSKKYDMYPWKCRSISPGNESIIKNIEKELSDIFYEFKHQITLEKLTEIIKCIQKADREGGFQIGGIAKYYIDTLVQMRKDARHLKRKNKTGRMARVVESLTVTSQRNKIS